MFIVFVFKYAVQMLNSFKSDRTGLYNILRQINNLSYNVTSSYTTCTIWVPYDGTINMYDEAALSSATGRWRLLTSDGSGRFLACCQTGPPSCSAGEQV